MSYYAWTQDLPIDAEAYAAIAARLGDAPMPGLVVHLAMEREDGTIHYLDVWESKASHDRAMAEIVHPAVHPVLKERDVRPAGEPPKTPVNVIDVRVASGSLVLSPPDRVW